jgi:hypothetical protein
VNTSLNGDSSAATLINCDRSPNGCSQQEVEEAVMESTAQYPKPL